MSNLCGACKYGHDTKPGGQTPSPGTVWCIQRNIQMAKNRQMTCFSPFVVKKIRHCYECKKSKITKPTGESPQLGNVWCEKKHLEINKQRGMECFE